MTGDVDPVPHTSLKRVPAKRPFSPKCPRAQLVRKCNEGLALTQHREASLEKTLKPQERLSYFGNAGAQPARTHTHTRASPTVRAHKIANSFPRSLKCACSRASAVAIFAMLCITYQIDQEFNALAMIVDYLEMYIMCELHPRYMQRAMPDCG